MKLDPVLQRAVLHAKQGNYEAALKILKSEEDRYSGKFGSFNYFYIYGIVSLYSGAYLDAHSFFHKAKQIKMKDPNTLLGLAVLYLRRMDTVQAVDYYLDIKELDHKNRIAKNALTIIRKYSDSDKLQEWLTPERLKKLFPPIPFPGITFKMVITTVLAIAAVVLISSAILIKAHVIQNPFAGPVRPSADFVLSSSERSAPVETGGAYKYILTRNQATELYDKALSLFTSYRDEKAKMEINRILESNASEGIKNKSRLILTYMDVPGFDNFKRGDNAAYAEVMGEPVLYRDVYVIWKGMASNVVITDEGTTFDLLVGYDTRTTLEGIVNVAFNIPVSINIERPLEVLGKIVLTGQAMPIRLEGVAVYQSGRLEQ
jgi:tetratricopeptide (TPR) repeat protein